MMIYFERRVERLDAGGVAPHALAMRWSVFALLLACGQAQPTQTETEAEPESEAATEAEAEAAPQVGPRPAAWVESRVAEARERMQGDDASKLVWDAIEAHGGLEAWHAKSTLRFEFDYQPLAQPERRMRTINSIDFWSARAHQVEVEGDATLGWDGEEAWIQPNAEAFPSPARFWALTPYYFVAMPFVAADPGTRYEQLDDAELDGVMHHIVKLTYGDGVGDAPDDYYVLYLHPETKRLSALRYVVSYPGFFPDGGHSPEKIMRYSEYREVDGLSIAGRLDTSRWDVEAGEPGEVVTNVVVSNVSLGETWDEDFFAKPEGAETSVMGPRE